MSGYVPTTPLPRLSLAVTGHRESNPAFAASRADVCNTLSGIFDSIGEMLAGKGDLAPVRLHNMLADGVDQAAADMASEKGWELVSPLPFGRDLNVAINAFPASRGDATALAAGGDAQDPEVQARAATIRGWYAQARLFELADRDAELAALHLATLDAPGDIGVAQTFAAHSSDQVALACRVMIEQSDLVIAVWDGKHRNLPGGTGHTVASALEMGIPVLRIDPARPRHWTIMQAPESLRAGDDATGPRDALLMEIVSDAIHPEDDGQAGTDRMQMHGERWHSRSSRFASAYRRIEAVFGGGGRPFRSLVQTYEAPESIALGSAVAMLQSARALPGADDELTEAMATSILPQFAWADAVSARLSDSYRSGMVANFILSALAITAGIAYLPLKLDHYKWAFALSEFLLLALILLNTWLGGRWRWHTRWFETRRVAEYLRHAPVMLPLGVARAPGHWPRGKDTNWPEYHSRHLLRALGLPRVAVTRPYLSGVLDGLIDAHVVGQRDYHMVKARRLTTVHHRLDALSGRLFILAVVSVALWLLLAGAGALGLISAGISYDLAKLFTVLGVLFPTWGAAIAGIRFFGDFERFAAISEITAEKLDGIHSRIRLLQGAGEDALHFTQVADIAHEVDQVVVSEIENWQSVFGGKHITVPA